MKIFDYRAAIFYVKEMCIRDREYVELNKLIFYDYYEPKFLEELKVKNISITEERIKYRINEMPDEYRGFGGDKRFIEDAKNGRLKRF